MKKVTFSLTLVALTASVMCMVSTTFAQPMEPAVMPNPAPLPADPDDGSKEDLLGSKPDSELTEKEKFARTEVNRLFKRIVESQNRHTDYVKKHGFYYPISKENRKKVTELLKTALKDDKKQSQAALDKIIAMGPDAMPILYEIKNGSKDNTKTMVCSAAIDAINQKLLKKLPAVIKRLKSDDWKTREAASKELLNFGAGIIPELKKLLKSDDCDLANRAREAILIYSNCPYKRYVTLWKKFGIIEEIGPAINAKANKVRAEVNKLQVETQKYHSARNEKYRLERELRNTANALRILKRNNKVPEEKKQKSIEKLNKETDRLNKKLKEIKAEIPKLEASYRKIQPKLQRIRSKMYRMQEIVRKVQNELAAELKDDEKN